MHGYVFSNEENCKYPFSFENGSLTIYHKDAVPIDDSDRFRVDLQSDLEYLVAEDIDTYGIKIFFVNHIPFASDNWSWASSESLRVYYWLELKQLFHEFTLNKLVFEFPELNYFYPVANGFKSGDNEESIFSVKPVPFQQTKQCFSFKMNGEPVELEFGVAGSYRFSSSAPLNFSSQLSCFFQGTDKISDIIQIYHIIKQLFHFLCRRKSICLNHIKVKCVAKDDQYTTGHLHILFDERQQEDESIIKETICIDYVKNRFDQLIQLISDNQLYTEHIPTDNRSTHHITTASFILDAAAFEWSFKILHRDYKPTEYRIKVKEDILNAIDRIKSEKNYNAKEKGEANLYSKIIKNTERSFSERVLYALREFDDVLAEFIQKIYKYNNLTYHKKSYQKIANELQNYRNAFAHGEIDREMKGEFILDTIILEWLNYCIVLKTAGYNHDEIFNIINVVFSRRFMDRNTAKKPSDPA